ncbi:retrovirus-related pol polyprotein from transposon TNT 1-94 [Tanacetum coccineum]
MADQDTPPPTITAMKIPIIKKGEYDIWSMRMRQYICHTDHNLWDIIVNGDLEDEATPSGEQSILAFGGNEESKKMQKNVLKHQFENFVTASNETLDKAYDRFQKLISQLEIHGAYVSKEDIKSKHFKKVYEDELKRSSGSNSASQNLAFLSSKNTNSTNEVILLVGDFGMEVEIDLEIWICRWQVGMLTVRVKKKGHFARECRSGRSQGRRPYGDRSNAQTTESSSQALVAQDGLGGYDWSNDFEVEPVNYALMAISSSNSSSSSDSEVQKCSKCLESFKCLQKNYDTKREKHNKAKLEIRGYEIALESLEARILGHEKNELAWGTTNEATIVKPKSVDETVVSKSKINRDEVIIEDWISDDKDGCIADKTGNPSILEFSVARTSQQNGVAERKNMTLIEATRTMLADSLLPIPFWAEAVNTDCYVLNRVLVTKHQNKTPYELLIGKFDGKSNEGYLLGYSTSSKAFRVYNKRTKRVEENLHINFLEDQPNMTGTGPNWMFNLDFLTNSINYIPVSVENQVNVYAGTQDSYVTSSSGKDKGPTQEYILLPLQPHRTRILVEDIPPAAHEKSSETMDDVTRQAFEEEKRRHASQKKAAQATSTNKLSTDRQSVSTDRQSVSTDRLFVSTDRPFGKNFSGKVTPLFYSMLVQQREDEGEASERPSDS